MFGEQIQDITTVEEISEEHIQKFIDRLLTKRPLVFYLPNETPSHENYYTLGELRGSKNELLAAIKYGSIECPRTENSDDLTEGQ